MPFIDSMHIENYRSLRSVGVRFEPLTIFVGPNGSGKSSLLRALQPNLQVGDFDGWRRERKPVRRRIVGATVSVDEEIRIAQTSPQKWHYLNLHLNVGRMREANDPAPDLIAIEEPEHALHPYLLVK